MKGFHPAVKAEIIAPGLKPAAVSPDLLQDRAEAPVAPGEHRLHHARVGVVPVIDDVPGVDACAQEIDAAQVLLPRDLGLPLEGAVGLWDEAGGGDRDLDAAVLVLCVLPPAVQDAPRHVRDADDVFIRLGGKAQHVVELDRVPAAGKGDGAGVEEIVLRDVLVDRVAQALAPALDGEG